ncbi:GNAT family N-acetyltransferase [Jannaschia sp. LMIT008]|uniref:GNAT family N-acetyltransferase n=1 Tax=Jannaschia maritima TaxID=3032585 RepID=UPI002810FB8D|nr:GNAT family N-acetyltransferase [Jannaschia sp. LMIT008]
MIPTLATTRLTLRAPALADFDGYARFYLSDAARTLDTPADRRAAWRYFTAIAGHWILRDFGWWMVDDGTGAVGFCGVHYPPTHPEPELGWVIYPSAQRRGYALEAATAARAWWHERGNRRLSSNIAFGNDASIALARRMGCTTDGAPLAHYPKGSAWIHPAPAEVAA